MQLQDRRLKMIRTGFLVTSFSDDKIKGPWPDTKAVIDGLYGEEAYLALNDALLQGGDAAVHNIDRFLETMGYDIAALRIASKDESIEHELATIA